MIKPSEIAAASFKKGISGYSTTEVDEYIEYLKTCYGELYAAFEATEEKLRIVASSLAEVKSKEESLDATIAKANEIASVIVEHANSESAEIISKAEARAKEINDAMSASCKETMKLFGEKYETERQKLIETEKKAQEFRASLLEAYKKQLALLCSTIPSNDEAPEESTPTVEDYKAAATERFKDKVSSLGSQETEG